MARQASSDSPPQYNKVYESLVKNQDDIVGFIAYGLYKKSKQDYIKAFRNKHSRDALDDEIATYVSCSELPRLKAYEKEAQRILKELLGLAVSDKQEKLEDDFKKKLWKYVRDYEPPTPSDKFFTFIKSSFSGVMGNFMTTVGVILILYVAASPSSKNSLAYGAKENIISGIAKVLGMEATVIRPDTKNKPE